MNQMTPLGTNRLLPPETEIPQPSPKREVTMPLTTEQIDVLKEKILSVLCTCYDPEIPVNIYELGLIYGIEVSETGEVAIRMTLTSPACPVAGSLPPEVQRKIQSLPNVTAVTVDLVWEPPWDKNRMSEAARIQLGLDDW